MYTSQMMTSPLVSVASGQTGAAIFYCYFLLRHRAIQYARYICMIEGAQSQSTFSQIWMYMQYLLSRDGPELTPHRSHKQRLCLISQSLALRSP